MPSRQSAPICPPGDGRPSMIQSSWHLRGPKNGSGEEDEHWKYPKTRCVLSSFQRQLFSRPFSVWLVAIVFGELLTWDLFDSRTEIAGLVAGFSCGCGSNRDSVLVWIRRITIHTILPNIIYAHENIDLCTHWRFGDELQPFDFP